MRNGSPPRMPFARSAADVDVEAIVALAIRRLVEPERLELRHKPLDLLSDPLERKLIVAEAAAAALLAELTGARLRRLKLLQHLHEPPDLIRDVSQALN